MKNKLQQDDEISKLFNDPLRLRQLIQEEIHAALLQHKRAGNPVCEWKNGKVVWVPASKIKVGIKKKTLKKAKNQKAK